MIFFQTIFEFIAAHWGWAAGAVCTLYGGINLFLLTSPYFRSWVRWVLNELLTAPEGIGSPYSRLMGRALDRIDRWLMPKSVEKYGRQWDQIRAKDKLEAARVVTHPFGWPLFDRALLLAFIYPIGLMVLLWVATGWRIPLGDFEVLPDQPSWWWERLALGLAIVLYIGSFKLRSPARLVMQLVALGSAFAVSVAVSVAGTGAVTVAVSVAVAGALGLVWALSGLAANGRGGIGFGLFTLVLFGLLFAAAALGDLGNEGVRTFLIFLGLIPLTNACFDYLSLGLTRLLLRRGQADAGRAILFGVLDLAAAFLFFTALGMTLILLFHVVNTLQGAPVVDLDALFANLRNPEQPGQNAWIYGMIFSTLLPTFLHFSLASFSLIAWIPRQFPEWCWASSTRSLTRTKRPTPSAPFSSA
ncbi:MAG: hypothetical protein AAGH74_05055 [Pseudomonadota bacterium]